MTTAPEPTRPVPTHTPAISLCSPLQDIPPAELPGIVVNPFHPPKPGSDDPHHGADFADLLPGSQVAIEGRQVNSVLDGRVATVIRGRFPYGNALIVETSLEALPDGWIGRLQLPEPAPTLEPRSALTCPAPAAPLAVDASRRSLYLLYAHMQAPPDLTPGDPVVCGQSIGAIGMSGNALNPHLHLEMRLGPAEARFASLAHYDASASPEEMAAYCTWRVSGLFQMIGPLRLLATQP